MSIARAMSARALIRCARSLRVLLMLIWTQHAVARGLVDLDVVLAGEHALELRAVVAGARRRAA